MKKLLVVLLSLLMVLGLTACSSDKPEPQPEPQPEPAPSAANNYADYLAADIDTELELLMSVQAHESWWDNKITVYAQDDDGGYLCYDMACEESAVSALTEGTLIKVKGYKTEWSGELELADATFEVIAGSYDGKVYDAVDCTSLCGDNEALAKHMNAKTAFNGLEVVNYSYNWDGSGTRDDSDIYLNVICPNGTEMVFVVRRYLTDNNSDVFQFVESLQPGDVVDLEAFMYWYEGPQARIYKIAKGSK